MQLTTRATGPNEPTTYIVEVSQMKNILFRRRRQDGRRDADLGLRAWERCRPRGIGLDRAQSAPTADLERFQGTVPNDSEDLLGVEVHGAFADIVRKEIEADADLDRKLGNALLDRLREPNLLNFERRRLAIVAVVARKFKRVDKGTRAEQRRAHEARHVRHVARLDRLGPRHRDIREKVFDILCIQRRRKRSAR